MENRISLAMVAIIFISGFAAYMFNMDMNNAEASVCHSGSDALVHSVGDVCIFTG